VSANDNIGAKYLEIADFFKDEEIHVLDDVPLGKFKANKDNQLGGLESEHKDGANGTISLAFHMITKSEAQKVVFRELLKLVAGEEEKHDTLTKDHFDTAMLLIDPHLSPDMLEDFFNYLDAD